uniref:Plant heme peroxidase family profile domain-containing protein n=1 Tax=Oryza punctata TaxID=4537 RepID=A0A0E0JNX9_ORYPU
MAAAASRTAGVFAVLQLVSIVSAAVLLSSPPAAAAELSVDFIDMAACLQSQVDSIVRSAVQAALQRAKSEQGMPPNANSLQPRALQLVEDIRTKLPGPGTSSVRQLIDLFGSRGMGDAADLVALSGSHTVGRSQCAFVRPVDDTFSQKMVVNPSTKLDLDVAAQG